MEIVVAEGRPARHQRARRRPARHLFTVVIAIGLLARRAVATSEDFFLSGRALPAWVIGLAFISANLGAIEILGMAANVGELARILRKCTLSAACRGA